MNVCINLQAASLELSHKVNACKADNSSSLHTRNRSEATRTRLAQPEQSTRSRDENFPVPRKRKKRKKPCQARKILLGSPLEIYAVTCKPGSNHASTGKTGPEPRSCTNRDGARAFRRAIGIQAVSRLPCELLRQTTNPFISTPVRVPRLGAQADCTSFGPRGVKLSATTGQGSWKRVGGGASMQTINAITAGRPCGVAVEPGQPQGHAGERRRPSRDRTRCIPQVEQTAAQGRA